MRWFLALSGPLRTVAGMAASSALSIRDRSMGTPVDLATLIERRIAELERQDGTLPVAADTKVDRYVLRATGVPEVDEVTGDVTA